MLRILCAEHLKGKIKRKKWLKKPKLLFSKPKKMLNQISHKKRHKTDVKILSLQCQREIYLHFTVFSTVWYSYISFFSGKKRTWFDLFQADFHHFFPHTTKSYFILRLIIHSEKGERRKGAFLVRKRWAAFSSVTPKKVDEKRRVTI